MFKCEFETGQVILVEGDIGQSIFIIKSGRVKCYKGEKEIRTLTERDYFGESALLFDTNRSLSIYAEEKTICYQISQSGLMSNLGPNYKNILMSSISKEAFKNSKYLTILANDNYLNIVAEYRLIKTFEDKEIIINAGDALTHAFYVLLSGNVECNGEIIAKRGELFGDVLLQDDTPVKEKYTAQGECYVLEYDWEAISPKLNINVDKKKILQMFNRISHLKKIQLFRFSSENRLLEIGKKMKKEKFEEGIIVFKEGEIGNKLYLIESGKAKVFKGGKFIREIGEGNCFGEIALLISEPRSATVIAQTNLITYTLTKDCFNLLIDKQMLNYLTKKLKFQDNFNQTLEDFYFCESLGKGKFGRVCLVHNKHNFYAMKAVSKEAAERQKILIRYFIQERNILLKLDHPFIMKLVNTFKNDKYIFFLIEYISGKCLGKLISSLSEKGLYSVELTRFYIGSLLITLSYLNSKRICHRDLKPDNIIVDEKGYLKVIDFGTCIELRDFTNTITGTPHYIAPEVLLGKGYGFSCDYWSVGIIAHYIYFGIVPFGKNARDPIDVYKEIVKKDLVILKGDQQVIQLIRGLLKKKIAERVCCIERASKFAIFKNMKWSELNDLEVSAPVVPHTKQLKDFTAYKMKYLEYLREEMEVNNNIFDRSLVDSYDEEDDRQIKYDSNWAEVF